MSILNEAANSAYGHVAYTPIFFYFYDQQCPELKDTSHRSAFFVLLATSCHTFTLILGEGHISFVSVRGGGRSLCHVLLLVKEVIMSFFKNSFVDHISVVTFLFAFLV